MKNFKSNFESLSAVPYSKKLSLSLSRRLTSFGRILAVVIKDMSKKDLSGSFFSTKWVILTCVWGYNVGAVVDSNVFTL